MTLRFKEIVAKLDDVSRAASIASAADVLTQQERIEIGRIVQSAKRRHEDAVIAAAESFERTFDKLDAEMRRGRA